MTRAKLLLVAHASPRLRTQSRLRGRAGTSLLEVLVGLGIMAVGAIGAFVLFPLSAINVSRALIDDRTTTCAVTADGQLRDVHRKVVDSKGAGETYFGALGPANGEGPSLPVVIDPMGFYARFGSPIGDAGETTISRVNLTTLTSNTLALRYCSQMDGLTFNEGGQVPGGLDMRELRYNWLWVVQRPVNRDAYTLRMQVVVFDRRTHMYAPPGTEAVYGKTGPVITFVPGTSTITGVPATAEVRKGSWVMDGTIGADAMGRQLRHAEFYRITSVTDAGDGTVVLETHRPIVRADGLVDRAVPTNYKYDGVLVVMPAVVEVFERPLLTDNAQ